MDLIRRALGRPAPAPPQPRTVRLPRTVLPRDDLHAFWRDPDQVNRPEEYLAHDGRSVFLLEFLKPYLGADKEILEIGCNVGRNLAHLFDAGYGRLTGIEINTQALVVLRDRYPELGAAANLINAPVEEAIRGLPDELVDIVFTMAVLEHIHPDSESLFDEIIRVTRSTIATVEDEHGVSRHHTPRDYREVFELRRMRQVAHRSLDADAGFGTPFEARIFVKAADG